MSALVFLEQTQHLKKKPDETWQDFTVQYRDLRGLKLNILTPYSPFLFRSDWEAGKLEGWQRLLAQLVDLSKEKSFTPPLIFLTDQECPAEIASMPVLKQHSIALLDKTATGGFVSAHDWEQKWRLLGRVLAQSIGMTALHPYVQGTPAFGGRFFGRSKVIEQITSGKTIHNCTIVGNRRIGKTSLMQEVKERLKDVYVEGTTIFFANLYAANFKSTWDAVYMVCAQLNINVPKKYMEYGAISARHIKRFPTLLHTFAAEKQAEVVIFIDEFDHFLEIDSKQNYEFLHLLREAVIADTKCHVLIAGFRRLMEMRVRRESPYFNFTSEIALTPLTRDEAAEMITVPLERLGLDVKTTNLPVTIQRETHGQPELIQIYCRAAVEWREMHGRLPNDNELQEHVRKTRDFSQSILQTFLRGTNPYEQAVCLNLMKQAVQRRRDGDFKFKFKEVEEVLRRLQFPLSNAQTAILLNNLVVGSVIQKVAGSPGEYQFVVPELLRFCEEAGLDVLCATAKAQAYATKLNIEALNMDTEGD
jgi:Cdc6-like AAA superfamily ATPase